MTLPSLDICYDVASAVSQGRRDYQEDAVIADFPIGSDFGFAVLADGMGGHSAGDIASKIVVTEVFSELKIQSGDTKYFNENISDILIEAALAANDCVKAHVGQNPETQGMGATLVAPVFIKDDLHWVSVGDSPLFLFRRGSLQQLNEDHSMAPQIDLMVSTGLLDVEEGKSHPDRNCLTSVIFGNDITHIDCPTKPLKLRDGDILIVASDGLQFLENEQIEQLLQQFQGASSNKIANIILSALEKLDDPNQDNISFSIIKIDRPSVRAVSPHKHDRSVVEISHTPARVSSGQPQAVMQKLDLNPLNILRRSLIPRGDAQ